MLHNPPSPTLVIYREARFASIPRLHATHRAKLPFPLSPGTLHMLPHNLIHLPIALCSTTIKQPHPGLAAFGLLFLPQPPPSHHAMPQQWFSFPQHLATTHLNPAVARFFLFPPHFSRTPPLSPTATRPGCSPPPPPSPQRSPLLPSPTPLSIVAHDASNTPLRRLSTGPVAPRPLSKVCILQAPLPAAT